MQTTTVFASTLTASRFAPSSDPPDPHLRLAAASRERQLRQLRQLLAYHGQRPVREGHGVQVQRVQPEDQRGATQERDIMSFLLVSYDIQ